MHTIKSKSLFLMLLFLVFFRAAAFSGPVYPKAHKVVQPDGTTLTIFGHGDEFMHYITTEDGTVVQKDADGFYRPTGQDVNTMAPAKAGQIGGLVRIPAGTSNLGGREYRGLVILVSFNDRDFSLSDEKAYDYFQNIMNTRNLTSYNPGNSPFTNMKLTGSVRDYFNDQSNGSFDPEFDVIGPIKMDVSQYYINKVEKSADLTTQILTKADEEGVDFSIYDSDNDGVIDMVYIMYAGYSSNYQGNDERLIWPHASTFDENTTGQPAPEFDGKKVGRYACSAEIFGWHDDNDKALDGIGTIVHEFSHVLGFQDHYDTTNGYQEHPNSWDVMSAGNYSEDLNRTPCGFNSYEKHAAGFFEPLDITDMGGESISLNSSESSHESCIIRSYQEHVSYFMENRQHDKWDKYLPGHGLLIWRVDSIRPEYWQYNYVNVTTRACFRLVRACGTQGSWMTGVVDTDYDPFPGTHNITEVDNDDDAANLISYDGFPCPVTLRQITETDGIISFNVEVDPYAENRPITYAIPDKLYVRAEKLVGEDWEPVEWVMTKKTVGEEEVMTNFLPDSENYNIRFIYMEDADHTVMINAQRVEKTSDFSRWMCNFNDVEAQGAGAFTFTVNRYGVPTINPELRIGFCTMKPSAYVVSQNNIIDIEAVYRNFQFDDDPFDATGIVNVHTKTLHNTIRKFIIDGHVIIVRDGKKYNLEGMEVR